MSTIEYWIQIENNPWDVSPKNIDRMTGETIEQITGKAPVLKLLKSPETLVMRSCDVPAIGGARAPNPVTPVVLAIPARSPVVEDAALRRNPASTTAASLAAKLPPSSATDSANAACAAS